MSHAREKSTCVTSAQTVSRGRCLVYSAQRTRPKVQRPSAAKRSSLRSSWLRFLITTAMVYLSPPQYESPSRRGYEQAYQEILATHRRSPLSSASSLIMLVAPDVDALCASRMLADLFKQDDVMHRVIPVSGMNELEQIRDELVSNAEVRTPV